MQHLEVSCAVRRFFKSLGFKGFLGFDMCLQTARDSTLQGKVRSETCQPILPHPVCP